MNNSKTLTNDQFEAFLKNKASSSECYLTRNVAKMILAQFEDPITAINNLLNHGCISGMVSGLVFYSETRAFYDENYHEIEDLRQEWEKSVGEPLTVKGDLKNFFAWFAFEQVAYDLATEAGLEV